MMFYRNSCKESKGVGFRWDRNSRILTLFNMCMKRSKKKMFYSISKETERYTHVSTRSQFVIIQMCKTKHEIDKDSEWGIHNMSFTCGAIMNAMPDVRCPIHRNNHHFCSYKLHFVNNFTVLCLLCRFFSYLIFFFFLFYFISFGLFVFLFSTVFFFICCCH